MAQDYPPDNVPDEEEVSEQRGALSHHGTVGESQYSMNSHKADRQYEIYALGSARP